MVINRNNRRMGKKAKVRVLSGQGKDTKGQEGRTDSISPQAVLEGEVGEAGRHVVLVAEPLEGVAGRPDDARRKERKVLGEEIEDGVSFAWGNG